MSGIKQLKQSFVLFVYHISPNKNIITVDTVDKCFWEDNCKVCPICDHKIPLERKHAKESLRRCYDCGAITHKDERTSKMRFYPPSDEEDKDD